MKAQKVKCISNYLYENKLEIDKIYTVLGELDYNYILEYPEALTRNCYYGFYPINRFEVIS